MASSSGSAKYTTSVGIHFVGVSIGLAESVLLVIITVADFNNGLALVAATRRVAGSIFLIANA